MKGQIILMGYDENAEDKLLIVEAGNIQDGAEGVTNIVRFPQLDVSIQRRLLADAIEFLLTH